MRAFTAPLDSLEEYGQIKERIKKNQGVLQVSGCIDSQKSHFIYCHRRKLSSETDSDLQRSAVPEKSTKIIGSLIEMYCMLSGS